MKRLPTWLLALIALTVVVGAVAASDVLDTDDRSGAYNWTTVTIVDSNSDTELATAEVRIADTFSKQYTGLSNTTSLDPNEGMLFIHDGDTPGYVMRDMAFAIDIVFIDSDGEITAIHHAEPDDDQTFRGPGRYVLELPHHYTTDNNITVGDRAEIPDEYR